MKGCQQVIDGAGSRCGDPVESLTEGQKHLMGDIKLCGLHKRVIIARVNQLFGARVDRSEIIRLRKELAAFNAKRGLPRIMQ